MKIAVIGIDNRPVCYNLVSDIAQIDEDIELFMPPRELLGDLIKTADVEKILEWFSALGKLEAIVLSLDTIAYGGLIPSRRSKETCEEIKERLEKFKKILLEKDAEIYAFSSIMRIPNNNVNEEEKPYWDKFGKKIFDYSFQTHKNNCESCIKSIIPSEILDDYLAGRKRNFEINKLYLDWQKQGIFNTLVFSKDDCAEYGFNVLEAKELEKLGAYVKTGADEIPLSLFARAIKSTPRVAVQFSAPQHKNLISNYEDVSIETCVKSQLELAGCKFVEDNPEMILYVNNFETVQGEIVMKVETKGFSEVWHAPEQPFMIADVRFANGADNDFVKQFEPFGENFYGYAAWNTSANTLGSLICAAKVKFAAKKYNDKAFKKLEAIRFLDDWAYQANVRQSGGEMSDCEQRVKELLDADFSAKYSFPWSRKFEIEVQINDIN